MSRLPSARSKQKGPGQKALAKKEGPAPGARGTFQKSPKKGPQLEKPQNPALAEQRQGLIRALARASPKVSPKASPKASRIA